MSGPIEVERGDWRLLGVLGVAVVFLVASWSRSALPFADDEAAFLHESLRASGQATSPSFGTVATPSLVKTLGAVRQLVGTSERALRVAFVVLLAAAAAFLADALSGRAFIAALIPILGVLALPAVCAPDVVRPWGLLVPPAALVVAVIATRPATTPAAVAALAGATATGALDPHAAILSAIVLLAGSALRGSLLDRMTALATAGVALSMAVVVHGGPELPAIGLASPDLTGAWERILRPSVLGWPIPAIVLFGLPTLAVIVGLFVRDEGRGLRVALFTGCVCALAAAACVTIDGARCPADSALALLPALLLLFASSAQSIGPFAATVLALLLAGLAADVVVFEPPPARLAVSVLDEARAVAVPGSALAVAGPGRIPVAVHARLGHSIPMPTIYVPEDATLERLSDYCRGLGIRQLWISPPPDQAPPGFSAPESRPSGAPGLGYLVVEGP